ncbi:DUF1003 domain-containing protein [Nodosilinea nodulosa]|uniref:DUF1003 domain-containing protein n=1 Tax=Nodosilinea nodulosa TaxID=416001 RepID=UPI0002FC972C|nr:DUF1003 domain-containing protein [Nodosilinea nodulosa]
MTVSNPKTPVHANVSREEYQLLQDLRQRNPAQQPLRPRLTMGDRISDKVAAVMGSWPFIIIQSILLACWVGLNVAAFIKHWDPYPFILLNLMLSFQAAYAAPIIMMSQNRQASIDRQDAQHDYEINMKAELEREHVRFAELSESVEYVAIVTSGSDHDPGAKSPAATASRCYR